jgi:hypothetical protein
MGLHEISIFSILLASNPVRVSTGKLQNGTIRFQSLKETKEPRTGA